MTDNGRNLDQEVVDFVNLLGSIPSFNELEFVSRLKSASMSVPQMQPLSGYFNDKLLSHTHTGQSFGGVDCSENLEHLAVSAVAKTLTKINDSGKHFQQLADATAASQVPDGKIQSFFTAMFTEHLDNGLGQGPKRMKLANYLSDKPFVTKFKDKIRKPGFDAFSGRVDATYPTYILFVSEYFERGPGFAMPTKISDLKSSDVVAEWRTTLMTGMVNHDLEQLRHTAKQLVSVVTAVFSPTQLASTQMKDYLSHLQEAGLLFRPDDAVFHQANAPQGAFEKLQTEVQDRSIFDQINLDAWQSKSGQLWTQWQNDMNDFSLSNYWMAGVTSAETDSSIVDTPNGGDRRHVHRATTHGYKIKGWVDANASKHNYLKSDVQLDNVDKTFERVNIEGESDGGSCFVAGTLIDTAKGEIKIEDLHEHCSVLTRLQPTQWGVTSDEVVKNPAPPKLYGFNGGQVFFTAGHVFHTSTGLRAVNPELARQENPWIEVGQLRVGHLLVRREPGTDSYAHVEVESIDCSDHSHEFVYGVHLREGLRSYHANGFLVTINYPEITVSSVASHLSAMPRRDRLKAVASLKELVPLLGRFGSQTVLDLIEKESKGHSLVYTGRPAQTTDVLARDVVMPYIAHDATTHEPIFGLELHSGVLHVEGKYCKQVSMKGPDVHWTRSVDDQVEHGWFKLIKNGLHAEGRMFRGDSEAQPTKNALRRFVLVPGAIPKPQTAHMMAAADTPIAAAAVNKKLWKFDFLYDPAEFNPSKPLTEWHPSQKFGSSTCKIIRGGVSYSTFGFDQYTKIRDHMVEHAKGEAKTEQEKQFFSSNAELFDIHETVDSSQQLTFVMEAKHNDKILQASDQYKTWIQAHKDDWKDKLSELPTRNLTFASIGLDNFTLPILFQLMRIKPGPFGDTPIGVFTEYDPQGKSSCGVSHWIAGHADYPEAPVLAMIMNNAISELAVPRAHLTSHLDADPAALTLAAAFFDDDRTITTKIASIQYDQNSINSNVQTTIRNIAAYHANEADRKTFFGDKPNTLDHEFAAGMENSPTAIWLRDVYVPAYICMILSNQELKVEETLKFTAAEKKRIEYFWKGHGSKCISREPIFKALERSVTRSEIRKAHKEIAAAYNSNNAEIGIKHSDALFDMYDEPKTLGLFKEEKNANGCSLLTKLAAIMDALDGGHERKRTREIEVTKGIDEPATKEVNDTNSNQLQYKVMAYQSWTGWFNPYLGRAENSDGEVATALENAWLQHAMEEIIVKLLNNSNAVTGSVLKDMGDDINSWGQTLLEWDKMDAKARALKLTTALLGRIRGFVKGLGMLSGWVKEIVGGASKWVWKKAVNMPWLQRSERLANWAKAFTRSGIPDEPGLPPIKFPLCQALLFTLGAVVMGAQLWQISNSWATSSDAQRTLLIAGVVGSFVQLANLGTDLLEGLLQYRGSGYLSIEYQRSVQREWDTLWDFFGKEECRVVKWDDTQKLWIAQPEAELASQRRAVKILGSESAVPIENEWELVEFEPGEGLGNTATQLGKQMERLGSIQRAFSIARVVLQVIGYVIAIAVAILLTWELIHNWETLKLPERIFQGLQVALALIEAVGAAIILSVGAMAGVASIAVAAGLGGAAFATSMTAAFFAMATVFASVTAVLAFLSVLVLVAMMIYLFTRDPPPDPVTVFLQERGKKFSQREDLTPPPVPTTFSITPSEVNSSESTIQEIKMSFTNPLNQEVEVDELSITFSSGKDYPAALFNDGVSLIQAGADHKSAGSCRFESSSGGNTKAVWDVINQDNDIGTAGSGKVQNILVVIKGPEVYNETNDQKTTNFKMQASETITFYAYGTVWAKKIDGKDVACTVQSKQTVQEDTTTEDVLIKRKSG